VGLLRHRHQTKLKLGSCLNHSCPLVSDVLQRGGYVYLLGALGHPVEDHVYQHVRPGPPHAVAAMKDHRTAPASVALVNFPGTEKTNIRTSGARG